MRERQRERENTQKSYIQKSLISMYIRVFNEHLLYKSEKD